MLDNEEDFIQKTKQKPFEDYFLGFHGDTADVDALKTYICGLFSSRMDDHAERQRAYILFHQHRNGDYSNLVKCMSFTVLGEF